VAEKLAGELIAGKSSELRQDNLLCTAYLIEAMSLSRLGEQDAAVKSLSPPTRRRRKPGSHTAAS
jgi:hypothetical protein